MDPVSLGYRTDLALLRLGGTEITDRGDHLVVRTPHNPTFWWGNFLLFAGLPEEPDLPAVLEAFAEEFPEAKHVALGFDGTQGTSADLAWFTDQGFWAEASAVMTATSVHPPARANADAVYRRLSSDEDWAQSVELKVRARDPHHEEAAHRVFAQAKAQTYRGLVTDGHGGWYGAFLDGRLVCQMGLFLAGPGLARFQAVETDPDFRRLGLAGSLVHHASLDGFERLGARTLVMVADPTYFAIDLYRSVGFAETETQLQVERMPGR